MTLEEFAALVKRMRRAQRDFFRLRKSAPATASKALAESRRLEKQVDAALLKIADKQGELF
jgi:hypothetical protein